MRKLWCKAVLIFYEFTGNGKYQWVSAKFDNSFNMISIVTNYIEVLFEQFLLCNGFNIADKEE